MRRAPVLCIAALCLLASGVWTTGSAAERLLIPDADVTPDPGRPPHPMLSGRQAVIEQLIRGQIRGHGSSHHGSPSPDYAVHVLESPAGTEAFALDINQRGDAVGLVDGGAIWRAYLWRGGSAIDLGSFGGNLNFAGAINDHGQVAGYSEDASFQTHGFLWERGVMTDLGSLGGSGTFVTAINARGDVLGFGWDSHNQQRSFIWSDGMMTDLGDAIAGGATAFNDLQQVVGYHFGLAGYQALLWDQGETIDLGVPNGLAIDVNNRGEIVGFEAGLGERRVFLWSHGNLTYLGPAGITWSGPFLNANGAVAWTAYDNNEFTSYCWSRGVRTVIPVGQGIVSGINNHGAVVGYSVPDGGPGDCFVWDGELSFLETPEGYEASVGLAINDDGQVSGALLTFAGGAHATAASWTPVHGHHGLGHGQTDPLAAGADVDATVRTGTAPGDGVRFTLRNELSGPVHVTILDVTGRVVKSFDDAMTSGSREVYWDGHGDQAPVRSGVYFARISDVRGLQATSKAVVVR